MTLESGIKDAITQKLEDGTIEKLVAEQLEKGVKNALDHMFGSYGDVTKVIESKVKSVMVPYLEGYDYSRYLVKLDSILVDVLQNSTTDNKKMLENFKRLMMPEKLQSIKMSELYKIWCEYVAKNVDTDGLEVIYEDGVSYETIEVTLDVDYNESRDWSCFNHAILNLECEHDKEMNFSVRIMNYKNDKKKEWSISYDSVKDIKSLRHAKEFEILLMRLSQQDTKLIIDTDGESDDIQPEKEPEPKFE